jgi:glycosyltransferase involved in cell wall biosynthesis
MSLSVLHFSTADNEGGSGRSAYRIHDGLRQLGHSSRMLVGVKVTHDRDVDTVHAGSTGRLKDRAADELTRRLGLQYQIVPSSRRVLSHPWLAEADVIQLYNLHGGYFSPRNLPLLSRRAPLVWRLSDMWAVTGHCAYSASCKRWTHGCGRCPDLATYPPISLDTTAWLWRQKQRIYRRCDMTIVAPSSWTEAVAKQSPLFEGFDVRRIPNGIDTSVFKPRERKLAREFLSLDLKPKAILFAAHGLDGNPRKGGEYVIEALRRLAPVQNTMLLLAGMGGQSWDASVPLPVQKLGYLNDDRLMAAAYASSDLIVAPSVLENLPNTVLEAMACGVPAVAFDTGGMADAVRHMETGYLAPAGDVDALAAGIRQLLVDGSLRQRLGKAGVELVSTTFSKQTQALAFAQLYAEILTSRRHEHVLAKHASG